MRFDFSLNRLIHILLLSVTWTTIHPHIHTYIPNNRAHEEVVLAWALLRMGDHSLPKRVMSGELENAGKRGPGGKDKEWTDCVGDDLRLFHIRGDWSTAALDPGVWCSTVHEGGCRSLAAWVKEKKMRLNNGKRREKRKRRTRLSLHLG